jgi:hypothetical protein
MLTSYPRRHQLSSIKHADRILFLGNGGKILEDGKHADLIDRNDSEGCTLLTGCSFRLSPDSEEGAPGRVQMR